MLWKPHDKLHANHCPHPFLFLFFQFNIFFWLKAARLFHFHTLFLHIPVLYHQLLIARGRPNLIPARRISQGKLGLESLVAPHAAQSCIPNLFLLRVGHCAGKYTIALE